MRKTFRTLLSAALLLLSCHLSQATPDTDAASALASRILPRLSRNIEFVQQESDTDFFSLETIGRKLVITGNNANSMAVGLNNYLRDWCDISVTWFERDAVKEPVRLPEVEGKMVRNALVGQRFFLNYCTYGYTLCWWQWKDWERLIDWMALNGVTLALANTGQEAVWQKVWMEFGMTAEQTREYFTGPAFLAWHRMSNIDSWDGPLPQSWIDSQAELQKKIVERELSLGINPILTSFNGHLPSAMRDLYPDADIKYLSDWGGYEKRGGIQGIKCSYLNPADPLYNKIQRRFLEIQKEMFGQDCHIYGIDPFNEVDPPCWEADYLADAGRRTYETLAEVDPEAIWLQMGWLFYYDKHWTKDLVKAYISPVPKGKLILIDYFCEKAEVYRQTDSFFGQDFIWSYLGNFGGNTMISGNLKDISFKLDRAYAEAGDNMTGVGCTLEGLGVDPPVFEYVLDRAWEKVVTDEEWIEGLADRHAGFENPAMRRAWKTMYDECQKQISGTRGMTVSCRPNMKWSNNWRNRGCCYDNHGLLSAWGDLVSVRGSKTPAFRFDCVNIARQCLENYFSDLYQEMHAAYDAKDRDGVASSGEKMLEVADDLERLCGSDAYFLMGKWIEDARAWGTTPEEKDYFEKDARLLLTCWAYRGAGLTDYANRCWNGLLSTYYRPRWESFTKALLDGLDGVKPFKYEDWRDSTTEFEWNWATVTRNVEQGLPSKPCGNSLRISRKLYKKYKDQIEASPGTAGISDNGGPNRKAGI